MSRENPVQPEVKSCNLATKGSILHNSPRKPFVSYGQSLDIGAPASNEDPSAQSQKKGKNGQMAKKRKVKDQYRTRIDDLCAEETSEHEKPSTESAPLLQSHGLMPLKIDFDPSPRGNGSISTPTTIRKRALQKKIAKSKKNKQAPGSGNNEPTSFFSGDEGDVHSVRSKEKEPDGLGSEAQVCGVVIGKPRAANVQREAPHRPVKHPPAASIFFSDPVRIHASVSAQSDSAADESIDLSLKQDDSLKQDGNLIHEKEEKPEKEIAFTDRFRTVRNPQAFQQRRSSKNSMHSSTGREAMRNLTHEKWIDTYVVPVSIWYAQSTTATFLKFVCIFGSIFFPDLWIIWQVPDNIALDVILSIIFCVFLFEFIITSLTDASYFFSLFAVMDAISSLSMITDVSYLLGVSATTPQEIDASDLTANSDVLVKLTRMARLVTRVGRLTRTSKALWLFVGEVEKREQSKLLRVMGHQLRQTLSMRLSWIMFCCVFVSPTTLMFVYPVADESLTAWPKILSKETARYYAANATEAHSKGARLSGTLEDFSLFFDRADYGPFTVCFRQNAASSWECKPDALPNISWAMKGSTKRKGSWWKVSDAHFQATYDMSSPEQVEAAGSIGLILSVTACLLGFSVTLQHGVTRLALKPLERMLSVVRYNCAKIFMYAADIESELEPANYRKENFDCNENTNESALLEAVIDKLVIVCERAVARLEPVKKVAETDEDHLVLFFQNKKADAIDAKHENSYTSAREKRRGSLLTKWQGTSGVPLEVLTTLDSSSFNALDVPSDALRAVAYCLMISSNGCGEFVKSDVDESQLNGFLRAIQDEYPQNPFHNFSHAIDVLATVSRLMLRGRALKFLSEAQQFVVVISAISHDLGHPGVSNSYLIEAHHELALTYNDLAPLENMHCATLFSITAEPDQNIFSKMCKANNGVFKAVRKEIIESILATDVSEYKKLKEKTQLFYELNHWELEKGAMTDSVKDLLRKESQTFQNLYLQVADTNQPAKPWDLCQRYANLIMEEGFAQGDAEKSRGLTIQPLNNRKRVCKASYQVGWIDLVVLPLTEAMIRIFPPLENIAEYLDGNFENWVNKLKQETRLTKDEAAKLQERTQKVIDRCEAMRKNRSWTSLPGLEED